jgi:hypothetical protein
MIHPISTSQVAGITCMIHSARPFLLLLLFILTVVLLKTWILQHYSLDQYIVYLYTNGIHGKFVCIDMRVSGFFYSILYEIYLCRHLFWGSLFCLFWAGSYYITQAGLEFAILLPQPPKCCDYRHVPSCLAGESLLLHTYTYLCPELFGSMVQILFSVCASPELYLPLNCSINTYQKFNIVIIL